MGIKEIMELVEEELESHGKIVVSSREVEIKLAKNLKDNQLLIWSEVHDEPKRFVITIEEI